MAKPNKQIKLIADELGEKYSLVYIDLKWCIYRDLFNGFDIEIANHRIKGKPINLTVYVWQVRDQLKVIETIEGISNIEDLRRILRGVVNKTNRLAAKRNKMYMPIAI